MWLLVCSIKTRRGTRRENSFLSSCFCFAITNDLLKLLGLNGEGLVLFLY